jgi:hypothetical protein
MTAGEAPAMRLAAYGGVCAMFAFSLALGLCVGWSLAMHMKAEAVRVGIEAARCPIERGCATDEMVARAMR